MDTTRSMICCGTFSAYPRFEYCEYGVCLSCVSISHKESKDNDPPTIRHVMLGLLLGRHQVKPLLSMKLFNDSNLWTFFDLLLVRIYHVFSIVYLLLCRCPSGERF